MVAAADRLYVRTGVFPGRTIAYSQDSGSRLTEYTTVHYDSKVYCIAVNIKLGLTAVLWYRGHTGQQQIIFYLLSENKSFLTVNVESDVSIIRISDEGRIVTGNRNSGKVKIYNLLHKLVTYDTLKQSWQAVLQKDDCKRLMNHFDLPKDQKDVILMSDKPTNDLLLALEERAVIYHSYVSRLIDAFVALQMNETFYHVANIYQENASATSYDRFLVTLSAHLTASVAGDLCSHFNIPDYEKSNIISSQNAGLSLLLALDEMGIITRSRVLALEQPFTNLRLVQAVAKIQEYQSMIEDDRDMFQHTTGLTKEEKRNLFMRLLQKKIVSWYEAMTPVPWKKSCQWKSSELFVGSSLILTNSKTQRNLIVVDERCKLNYTEIFTHVSLKEETRIIIEGEPGSGKTMLSSQLAYDWSQGNISDINILILLPLKFVQRKTLVEATKDFYHMEDKGLSLIDIEDVINEEGGKCCFLLDGLEEYNGKQESSDEGLSEVMKVMTKVKHPSCKVILTSRSDYIKDMPPYPMLKLGSFDEVQRQSYIEKVFSDDYEKQMEVKNVIDESPFLLDLCSVPLLLVLAVHNIGSIVNVQDVWQDKVSPFIGLIVETLCPTQQREDKVGVKQRYDDCRYTQQDEELFVHESYKNKSQEISLDMLAFNGLCRGKQQLSWQKRFMEENVRNMKQYLDSGIVVVEEAVNVGIDVVRTSQENADTEQVEGLWSEVNENASGAWNIPKESDKDSGRVVITQEEPFREALKELQKENVDTTINEEWKRRSVEERSDVLENTKQPIALEKGEPVKYSKNSLTLQHVSLHVKFLHKVLQEWFAARYLANICWKYDVLPLSKKYNLFREHLQQINPADLHYVLRFTCALCPPSCRLILDYLLNDFRSEEGKIPGHIVNCICLCLAEYDGNKERCMKDIISKVCKADITIHPEDSRLLQRVKVSMLQLASNCNLPITRLQLPEVIVGASEDELIFNSGATLKILNTLQKIEISRWDYKLEEKYYSKLIKFVINSEAVEKALLIFPSQPPILENETLKEKAFKQVSVEWRIGQIVWTLDLSKARWMLLKKVCNFHPPNYLQIVEEETALSDVTQTQLSDYYTSRKTIITKDGGILDISKAGIMLVIPPNALPADKDEYEIQMRYISRRTVKDQSRCFSSNSTAVVEILPDLTLEHPVRLSLPHCLVLQQNVERKAKIFTSHHKKGTHPFWEEDKNVSYHVEDTTCIILLNSFSWYRYCIDDEIVIAKKIVVYAAAEKPKPDDDMVRIEVGCCPDLPGEEEEIQGGQNLIVAHKKILHFVKSEKKYPLRISLNDIFPSGWQCRCSCKFPDTHSKEIPYDRISMDCGDSCVYIITKSSHASSRPVCVFTALQEKDRGMDHLTVQLAVNLQVIDKLPLMADATASHWEPSLKAETTISKSEVELEIPNTGVVLKIPSNALQGNSENRFVGIRIIPSRIIEGQVTTLCSNSCTAVEIFPNTIKLQSPAELRLPHCLIFKENSNRRAKIFTNNKKGSPAKWKNDSKASYTLDDKACVIKLNKLCCVRYCIDDNVVKGKKIRMYTAAKEITKSDEVAELEVGYHPDIPGGGELLRMNPHLEVDSKKNLLFMGKQRSPLQLSLDDIAPSRWTCWFPKDKPRDIPFEVIAASIEHSHLFILQKASNVVGKVTCKFTALQKEGQMATELALTVSPKEDRYEGMDQSHQMKPQTYSMTDTFQLLAKKLTSEWKSLGRKLCLDDAEIYRIETDCKETEETIYQMLQCWKKKEGSSATYALLVTALEGVGRTDLAEKVQHLKDVFEEA
ncbi:Netrin receptor UNC5D [Holothuria leucospilota]|uniref:Netrin receptor UNC5 n=1 Tax=Holothuria leucospilota TaxID=206669 RepID=A0A9Q1BVP3_HOLLE|nr:Netrin receptor UNC5D [Holothuria leucospilota]